ncbi:hypothetical protein BKI52_08410 [marine bacterium AO1-C]|nr:hypothetical protein BKI52_08410 [marine bacterium AO1-C]
MHTLNNNRFTQIFYDPVEKLIKQTWKFNAHKNQLHFFGNLSEALDAMYTYNPQRLLIDFNNFTYSLDQDGRSWVINNFFTQLFPLTVDKIALVKSKDTTTQHSLELILDHSKLKDFNIHFFDQENQAYVWFKKKTNTPTHLSIESRLKAS